MRLSAVEVIHTRWTMEVVIMILSDYLPPCMSRGYVKPSDKIRGRRFQKWTTTQQIQTIAILNGFTGSLSQHSFQRRALDQLFQPKLIAFSGSKRCAGPTSSVVNTAAATKLFRSPRARSSNAKTADGSSQSHLARPCIEVICPQHCGSRVPSY